VGGKGGVGKTTCAATLALAAARESPNRRVLLISTDPAHSIGDVLGQPVGDSERHVQGGSRNLIAREIDATRRWHERREQYRKTIEGLFETLTGGPNVDLSFDHAVIEQLFELAPPGMDEAVSIMTISDALLLRGDETRASEAPGRFDLVIVDSAPTGHTRRLLALPTQALAWVHQFMAIVVKYKTLAGFEGLARDLLQLSRGLKRLQALLTNERACGFVVVTRPEQLPDIQTVRLIEWLARHHISQRALIINNVTPEGCSRCRRIAARERREIAAFTGRLTRTRNRYPIVLTDAVAPPPKGAAALAEWERTWRLHAAMDHADPDQRVPPARHRPASRGPARTLS
jgi:arsenite-transporting ATPase